MTQESRVSPIKPPASLPQFQPKTQTEFESELEKTLQRTRSEFQQLTPSQRLDPRFSLPMLELRARKGLEQRYQRISATEELQLSMEAGEFSGLPPAVASSYLTWRQQESELLREELFLENEIVSTQRTMQDVGAPTYLTKITQWFQAKFGALTGIPDPRASGVYEQTLALHNTYVDRMEELSTEILHTRTYQSLYEGLGALIESGKVSSYEDLFTLETEDGIPITIFDVIGKDDSTLRQVFDQVSSAVLGVPEGTSLKELDYDEMIAHIAMKPRGAAITTIQSLTVDALLMSMAIPRPTFHPEFPTIEATLEGFQKAGVPDELVDELEDLETYVQGLEEFWLAISDNQQAVLQGLEEARMPEMGIGALILQTISQPALTALDLFGKLYSEWIAPWGGFLFHLKSQGALDRTNRFPSTRAERDFMRLYNEARTTDDWWHAGGKAFAEAELGFLNRFLFEWVADPLTWLGFGIGGALVKAGAKGAKFARFVGPTMNIAEKGYLKFWDILIFDRIKSLGKFIPKTFFQSSLQLGGDDMASVAKYLVARANGTYYSKIPLAKAVPWLREARNWAIHHPEDGGTMGRAGQALLRQDALNEPRVIELAKKFGSELGITPEMVLNVNSVTNGQIVGRAGQVLTRKTSPAFLLRTLGVAETPKSLKLARREINKLFQAGVRESEALMREAEHVPDLLAKVFNRSHNVYLDVIQSAAAHNLEMSGKLSTLVSRIEWTVMGTWRNTIDRWVVTPGARMYLAFSAYGPGNVLEGFIKQATSRQVPFNPLGLLRGNKPVSIVNPTTRGQRLMVGLSKPIELEAAVPRMEMAGETPSFLQLADMSIKGRKALGTWRSVLSGGPIGRFFIDLPGRVGVHQRWDYYRKVFLSVLGEDEATVILSTLAKNIDDAVRTLPDDTLRALNITKHELEETLLERAIQGPAATRSFLDDIVADRLLLAEETVKREARKVGKKVGARAVSADQALADRISGGRVGEAVGKYPLVPQPFTDDLVNAASDGSLWAQGGKAIDTKVESYTAGMYDYFVHTPDFYKTRFRERVDGILAIEPRTKEEFTGMLQELQDLQKFYSESTDDVIRAMNELEHRMSAQMKYYDWNEWRGQYTREVYEGMAGYGDVAQDGFEQVAKRLRTAMDEPEKLAKVDWGQVVFEGLSEPQVETVKRVVDAMPLGVKTGIKRVRLDPSLEMLGVRGEYEFLRGEMRLNPKFAGDPDTITHEMAHAIEEIIVRDQPQTLKEFSNAVGKYGDVADQLVRGEINIVDAGYRLTLGEQFSEEFTNYVLQKPGLHYKVRDFFEEYFPKTQRAIDIAVDEQASISKLMSAWTDEQRFLKDFWAKRRAAEVAEIAAIKPLKGEARSKAWAEFRNNQETAHAWRRAHQEPFHDAVIKQEFYTSEALGTLGFYPPTVDATGRKLTKLDVATLFKGHPSQLPQSMLRIETMTLKSRKQFISEVRVQAEIMGSRAGGKTASAFGFSDDAIGEVYDDVLREMYMSPEAASVLEPHLMELKALKDEIWSIYNTKGVAKGTVDDLQTWLDNLGDTLDDVPGYATPKVRQPKFEPVPETDVGLGERLATKSDVIDEPGLKVGELFPEPKTINKIRNRATELAEKAKPSIEDARLIAVDAPPETLTLRDAVAKWFVKSDNDALQVLGRTASKDKAYLAGIHAILNEQYPSGYIRLYRGGGAAKGKALEREWTNVTSSRRTAVSFEDNPAIWSKTVKEITGPSMDNVLVKVDDIVSIGAVEESELIIKASVLRERLQHPLKLPAPPIPAQRGLSPEFQASKQRAADKASKEYYKDWADYTNENSFTALSRTVYPFWTYELHRLFWLPRASIRTPGVFKGWGTYMDYTEDGYSHIPGTSLEVNPLRGTVFMGGLIRLMRRDYPEYYDRFPEVTEFSDFLSRYGFYPATYLNFLKVFGGKTAQGKANWGELLPAWVKTPLNAYIAIHPDSTVAKTLLDTILPEIFRDYTTVLVANAICQREQKTFNGMDIADKKAENLELTEEENEVWTRAVQQQGWMSMIMEQAAVLRIRTEEQIAAWEASGKLIEELTGYTLEDQLWIRRHGFRVGDYAQLDPLEQALLGEMDAMKYHSGVFSSLMPSTWQEEDRRRREFFGEIRSYSEARLVDQETLDGQVRTGDINMTQWARARSELKSRNANFFQDLSETERYMGVAIDMEDTVRPDGSVREGMITRAKDRNMLPPIEHPAREILNAYYSIELEKKLDPASGKIVEDWDGYFQRIDTIISALSGVEQDDFVKMITRTMTDLEKLRWEVSKRFFRGYNRRQEAILRTLFDKEEQALIKRWIFGSPAERDAMQEVIHEESGKKLISYYQSLVDTAGQNLRTLSPELDAWLQFFETTDTTLTDEAARLYTQYRKDWGIPE